MVAHIRGGQGEEWLACLVRRNGCNASGAKARRGSLPFTPIVVGAGVRAAVTAVCAGSDVAGVGAVRTVCTGLVDVGVLFGVAVIAVGAGGAALLERSLSVQTVGVGRVLATGRLAAFVWRRLLLSVSRRGAAAAPQAG